MIKGNNSSPVAAVLEEEVPLAQIELGKVYVVTAPPGLEAETAQAVSATILAGASQDSVTVVPDILRVRDVDGEVVDLKAYVLAGRPLRYVESTSTYSASIKMGVFPVTEGSSSRKLSAPIVFEILDGGIAKEAIARVEQTSPPYVEVTLEFSSDPQPRSVRVSSPARRYGVAVPLTVQPSMQLIVERPEIQGYGLETSKIIVALTGVDKLAGHPVAFSSAPGYIEMKSTTTDEKGHLTATLRSEGTGSSLVTATIPGVARATQDVVFTFPALTLIASLIGGLVGGTIRLLSANFKLTLTQFFKDLFVAALIGGLVFGLYTVGVNTLPVQPTVAVGTILVIVISAVGAYLGNLALRWETS